MIGTPINEYAGGDLDFWADSVKKARDWDKSNPNTFTSKEMHSREYKQVLTGMGKFISYIENNKEKIREQRKANGLTNREQENQHGQIKAALLSSRHFNLPVI